MADPPDSEVTLEPDLLVVDVSGVDGRDGADGASHAGSSAPRGQDGQRGGDASEPQPGEHAGEIDVWLRPGREPARSVQLEGHKTVPGQRPGVVRHELEFGELGSIRLLANGGKGGHGGRGGEGQAGGKGFDGSDATRFSSGGDGGPGGDGGDGGEGTSGAPGGDGGRIVVHVAARDTDLMMLVQPRVAGGEGGQAGANGAGGSGGPGGDGGSSYSWTTTSTETRHDAQGRPQQHTVHHHHSNPGGSDGPRGRSGRDAAAVLVQGASGRVGQSRILVHDDGRVAEFAERYEVEIEAYRLELEDEFAEPTSRLTVSEVGVVNTGGMPTPTEHRPHVELARSAWVEPEPARLVLPAALEPGHAHAFTGQSLAARVPELNEVPVGDPLRVVERINPLAVQSRVNRRFANLHPRQEFTVAFPAELESVASLESQAPGRAALMVVQVKNRSRRDLGHESAGQRVLGVRIELQNRELASHVMQMDLEGRVVDWETGYHFDIKQLAAGETAVIRTIVGVLPGAPGYQRAQLLVTLELGQLHEPAQPRDRHRREYPVRIARAYDYDPASDILLLTNHSTTAEELEAWQAAAAALGQTVNVWDISLNDVLSLAERLAHGQSLLRDWHGKTIVLANGPFQTALGTRYADQFLSQMDLIRAAASHGIRILVVNDREHEISHLFGERLIPTDGEPEYRHASIQSFEKSKPLDDVDVLLDQVDELVRHGARAAQVDPTGQTTEIDLYGIRAPNAKRLQRQARRLQRRLQHQVPGRRAVVVYRLPEEVPPEERKQREEQARKGGLFFSHDYQGTLTVMPSLGDNHPNLVILDADASEVHAPDFITGASMRIALLQAMSFQEKVYLLNSKLRDIGEAARIDPQSVAASEIATAESLADAILIDLVMEQATVLKTNWQSPLFGATIRRSLVQLKFLAEHQFALLSGDAQQPDVQIAARLLGGLEFLGKHACRWYERRWFPWSCFRRGPALRAETLRQQQVLARNLLGHVTEDQQRLIRQHCERHVARLKALRQQERIEVRAAARRVIATGLTESNVRTDAGRAFPEALSFAQWEEIRQAEAQREQARVTLQQQKELNRAALAVARAGRALPNADAEIRQALEPFVAACASARAKQEERIQVALERRAAARHAAAAVKPAVAEAEPQRTTRSTLTERD